MCSLQSLPCLRSLQERGGQWVAPFVIGMSPITIVEIKARCTQTQRVRDYLRSHGADIRGIDHQTDTYFRVPRGRLKLREGSIENALIYYERTNQKSAKQSNVLLTETQPDSALKAQLTQALGVLVVVKKQREIAFIDNVKFHIDSVEGLGPFVEIEAIDREGALNRKQLRAQCQSFQAELGIQPHALIAESYSDLLLAQAKRA